MYDVQIDFMNRSVTRQAKSLVGAIRWVSIERLRSPLGPVGWTVFENGISYAKYVGWPGKRLGLKDLTNLLFPYQSRVPAGQMSLRMVPVAQLRHHYDLSDAGYSLDENFEKLVEDIRKNGVITPLNVFYESMRVADGWRRVLACRRLGIEMIPALLFGRLRPVSNEAPPQVCSSCGWEFIYACRNQQCTLPM